MLDEHGDKFPQQVAVITILIVVVALIILALFIQLIKMPPMPF